ncbi:MAG: acyl--CoA ligase [Phycisphaerae bacterium]|jgi:acyl-CoA synthetase (AMP-forming)/AMP-acid ligase II|nr:acyl--CoA ligase [Phycisphaerae bacterium]
MPEKSTIMDILAAGGSEAVALAAPGRKALTYGELRDQANRTVTTLNHLGIGRNDRVAIILPNGPEMAASFMAIATGATTAPLNPAYRREEFDFYLSDLAAKALVVEQGSTSPAVEAAEALHMVVLEIGVKEEDPAGKFEIVAPSTIELRDPASGGTADADDIALVLHTSGTTSKPKIVPLTQRNICASAAHIRTSLALTPMDRCMNVMPLFHIHGLMAAVLASISVGAEIFCTPGFNAFKFFAWLEEATPTWYTAVPTMHQAVLARAGRNRSIIERTPLRFIRSSSSSLPPQVMADLEKTFDTPVIEAYAMTEAAHQMTSNTLPPGVRKPGTVGVAAGPEVAVMNQQGVLLAAGTVGEVVIQGPNVTPGYENNPQANAENFTNGWFRTGDQGVMDEEGFLTITGRLKEIINRGGEKISPREVDDVLMDYEAIQQVVTFAMPHDKLGEDVAAAVVLRDGTTASERDIRMFAATRLADFKVPRKILFLDEIPKGATGKIQRIGLAKKLGIS